MHGSSSKPNIHSISDMIFLVDKPMAEIAFRTIETEPSAEVVLIQDGVLLDPEEFLDGRRDVPTYAVERDLAVRGITPPEGVDPIEYDDLLGKILDQEVKTFV